MVFVLHRRERGRGCLLGRKLEDLLEELGGPGSGIDLRGLDVVVADDREWVGVEDYGMI